MPIPASASSNGILVSDIKSVTDACIEVLQTTIDLRFLRFNREKLAGQRYKCMLVGGIGSTKAFTRETYVAHRFYESRDSTYWLSVALIFQFEAGKYRFESASLLVFEGLATDYPKTPLLRAEWDCTDKEGSTSHAQPHWHVYLGAINPLASRHLEIFEYEAPIEEFGSPSEEQNRALAKWDGSRFHFAMASSWHQNASNSHRVRLTQVEELINWMKGCISYTRSQLAYLSR